MDTFKSEYGRVDGPVLRFDNIAAIVDCVEHDRLACPDNAHGVPHSKRVEGESPASWFGLPERKAWAKGERHKTLEGYVTSGWDYGAERIEREVETLETPHAKSVRRRAVWSDHGHEVDMQRVWGGQLDTAWRRMARAEVHTPPRVTIVNHGGSGASTDADKMFWRGAAACKLATELTAAGYAVRIVTTSPFKVTGGGPFEGRIDVTVCDYTSPVILSDIAATIALAGFFRGYMLSARCRTATRPIHHTFGYTRYLRPEEIESFGEDGSIVCLTSNHMAGEDGAITSARSASRWVTEQIERLNTYGQELAA